ncbi:MAG TPA: FecR domain-containing protein [Candidatus Acidoferrum sp.]|nr:FecR domain-containing protein [Candidatus Acidoferrum sp.]
MTTPPNDEQKKEPNANDVYLWDATGAPDAEVQRLESLLADFRYSDRSLILPAEVPEVLHRSRGQLLGFPRVRLAAAAVVLLSLTFGAYFLLHRANPEDPAGSRWKVSSLEGAPHIGSQAIAAGSSTARFRVGETLVTDSASRASISEFSFGEIRVDPDSRIRLVQSGPDRKRIQLEVGTIHAAIWAPPTQFIVDTPSATAVDLGCRYTLQVAPDGSSTLRTTLGWVGFHLNGRDSFIPAGAMCSTRPEIGPGTPYFEDASPSLKDALIEFDRALPSTDAASRQLDIILKEARARDGLTLWHLLSRTNGPERAQVYARFSALVPPPAGVTRDGILQLDPHMLDLYWNALGLGDISIWRFWEQNSNPHAAPTLQKPILKKQM